MASTEAAHALPIRFFVHTSLRLIIILYEVLVFVRDGGFISRGARIATGNVESVRSITPPVKMTEAPL